jgi:hypothetical protein
MLRPHELQVVNKIIVTAHLTLSKTNKYRQGAWEVCMSEAQMSSTRSIVIVRVGRLFVSRRTCYDILCPSISCYINSV